LTNASLRLAALRMLFDWLVVGQVMASNPAHAVLGPKYTQKKGKTPVLTPGEARASGAARCHRYRIGGRAA
jgi:site-specific recombinase XerD